jgi:protein-S-isoprenylcysteine O-methyltransferase Ste14
LLLLLTLRVLPKDDLTDYEIGIPSSGRLALKMNSINDIVTVHRDMEHAFKRHSQEQTIAILGTVLAVAQVLTVFPVFTSSWKGVAAAIAVCVIAIALMLYFALSEERVKVK